MCEQKSKIQLKKKPTSNVNSVNSTWLKDMIKFMGIYKIKIIMNEFFNDTSQNENNKCIMIEYVKLHLMEGELTQLNVCRPLFQVSHLSDITNPNGK